MNRETGEAETPAHPYSLRWRVDLDRLIDEYEARQDRERARAELSPKDRKAFDRTFPSSQRMVESVSASRGSFDAVPNHSANSLMGRLIRGEPISGQEARHGGGR